MKKNLYWVIILILAGFSSTVSAQTAQPVIAYVTIQGSRQGSFKGDGAAPGRQGQIECLGFSYAVQVPSDLASGAAIGKRQHMPIVIVKRLDGASPQLMQSAYMNEVLKTVTIEFVRPGQSSPFQTIKLTNAIVSKLNQYGGVSSPDKLVPNAGVLEEVSFNFQKIEVDNPESKTAAVDNWSAR